MAKRQDEAGEEGRGAWERLREQARQRFGPEMVFGDGAVDATLAIVGEAPGEQEVAEGRPFVGRAGRLLDRLLRDAGIDRGGLYVTNTVKIRPTVVQIGRVKNRPPRAAELKEGLEVLLPELRLVAPRALLLFGNVPAKALIGRDFAMGTGRGTWHDTIVDIPALATYHPAYLIRLEGEDFDRTWEVVLGDLATVRQRLEQPTTPG